MPASDSLHVCHLITALSVSGSSAMLAKLLRAVRDRVRLTVIAMTDDQGFVPAIRDLGVPVHTLGMSRGRPNPFALWRLGKLLRGDRPDVLQTWLYHADLMGLAAARTFVRCPVVWNVRHATLARGVDSRSTLLAARASARLSRFPGAIVVNSKTGRDVHVEAGYDSSRMRLFPNGFDLDKFRPSPEAGRRLRNELGIEPSSPIIGLMARFSSLKGQPTFIDAMDRVHASLPNAHFVMCGTRITPDNAALMQHIQKTGRPAQFHLLGERADMGAVQPALDVAVSASTSEAFSNSIGEALACGVPVVTTDAGDSSDLVGDAGRTVPIGDASKMAEACVEILRLPAESRRELGERARRRMAENYDIGVIADQYLQLWRSVAAVPVRKAA